MRTSTPPARNVDPKVNCTSGRTRLASAASRPLGSKTFRLISVAPFRPESHTGQKMEARGLIYTEPGDERLNLTSLKTTGGPCS